MEAVRNLLLSGRLDYDEELAWALDALASGRQQHLAEARTFARDVLQVETLTEPPGYAAEDP